jgi:hypothetical protein
MGSAHRKMRVEGLNQDWSQQVNAYERGSTTLNMNEKKIKYPQSMVVMMIMI